MTTLVDDPQRLRRAFGVHPTGVAAVAALVGDELVGLAASSFISVSLSPPLVSICIAHTSTTWPTLRSAVRLGVSILSAEQEHIGRQLAGPRARRFNDLAWRLSDDGAVLIDGAAGWFETSIETELPAGDHDIVLLRVHDLDADHAIGPLVFHASTFRRLDREDRQ